MSKDAEKRAVEALYLVDEWQTIGRGTIEARPVDIARHLADAGLLLTPLAEEAIEACKAYAQKYGGFPYFKEGHNDPVDHIESVGRRILESEKKDEGPWTIDPPDERWRGWWIRREGEALGQTQTEAEAIAVRDALNSLHRKERGK